ncbi:uncharacterized protein EDB91DRAFT_1147531 [Suillus paluster]|uniref:uncharacterized protein n=1 Tax=Suillus paluster TaxID=48578 RepID=UPI001B883FBA|nr:uncharacterized protein EDB91DRAFT_1147531 [Suillus paluster]KAG1734096.1 hypothetical protein EDB91DRAFT_1147531 [Suillus paluster]
MNSHSFGFVTVVSAMFCVISVLLYNDYDSCSVFSLCFTYALVYIYILASRMHTAVFWVPWF